MTNKEAIDCIRAIHVQMFHDGKSKWTEACEMAIEALKAQDVPDTNVGDMISRQKG